MALRSANPFTLSPPETCRATPMNPPQKTRVGVMERGGDSWVSPGGVAYSMSGMTVRDFNRGLRLPQKRDFLGPEIYNGGCAPLMCKDTTNCPNSVRTTTSPQVSAMFDQAFSSMSDFTGNDAPTSCFVGDCASYNSVTGWQYTSEGALLWQAANPTSMGSCAGSAGPDGPDSGMGSVGNCSDPTVGAPC